MAAKAVVVFDPSGQPLPNVEATLIINGIPDVLVLTNQDGYSLSKYSYSAITGYIKVVANNYRSYLQLIELDNNNQEIHVGGPNNGGNTIYLPNLSFNKPSRDRIINVKANLCNVNDAQGIPIFEPFIDYLIVNDRPRAEDWITRLKQAGGTHINLAITGDYNENLGWAPRYPIPGMDWTNHLSDFSYILDFVLSHNLIPILKLGFDGQGYDSIGWTYGWQWGMDNIERIANTLSSYNESLLWSTGFDGCFPDWTPQQTIAMLRKMRAVLGNNAQIDTEFAGAYCHMGNGAADWHNNQLDILDHFSLELQYTGPNEKQIQEIATRMLGPGCLVGPQTPYYLEGIDKKIAIDFYEQLAYLFIHRNANLVDVRAYSNLGFKYGFTVFGNGLPG